MTRKLWTKLEITAFKKLCSQGKSPIEMAQILERSYDSIAGALKRFKLTIKEQPIKLNSIPLKDQDVIDIDQLKKNNTINWKIVRSIKPSQKKNFKTYLVVADIHVPHQNNTVLKSIWKLMDDVIFDGMIFLGDQMDMTPVSHWLHDKGKNKSLENQRMLADYIVGNQVLDEFDRRLSKDCDKRWFHGNHENWYEQFIEKFPALEGLLDPAIELKLKERGYKVYDQLNHIERIGRLNFTHGIYATTNVVKKHIDELKSNVMFGHVHSNEMRLAHSAAREIAISGYSIGSCCDLSPSYMQGRPNNWSHGFAVVYFYGDNYFDVDLKRIIDGRFFFNNKLYDGNT